jgi:aquaporin Z
MKLPMKYRLGAEFFGTFWLVFGGCGAAIFDAAFPKYGIGHGGVALAFGLTVLTMIYAVGYISGGHFNPAVTMGFWASGRFSGKDVLPYVVIQVLAAIAAAGLLYVIAIGKPGFQTDGFASNGYGALSPGNYGLLSCLITEIVCTFFFVTVILGATSARAPVGFAGLAIGLTLTLIHLISIPIDNTSVNPARSTGPALIAGAPWIHQLWLFWLAPIVGAVIAGVVHRWFATMPSAATAK